MRLRSTHDRRILALALPALGALAAGPLYTLVDTAIVGHLGVRPLAALALAGTLLAAIVQLADFLSYGTTAHVARLHGAGKEAEAGGVVAQALAGSALGTLIAQLGMGAAFIRRMLRVPADRRKPDFARMRPLIRTAGHITVRTAALLGAFTLTSALAAHLGAAALAAHQVAFELFLLLALVLDAIAIAGQILVAGLLGAGQPDQAWEAALRMLLWSVLIGTLLGVAIAASSGIGPHAFTGDQRVLALSHPVWLLLALMQPLAAAVFALDGILIGAGDTRYLAGAMVLAFAAFLPAALAAGTLTGLWWALNLLILARLVTLIPRFARRRWAVVGARVTDTPERRQADAGSSQA